MKLSREALIEYMVDCLGYSRSQDDLDYLSNYELVYDLTPDELVEAYVYSQEEK